MFATDPNDALVPLFGASRDLSRVEQIGTGIFVGFQSMPFLLTAAHVTDNLDHGALMAPTPLGIVDIDGYVAHIDLPPELPRAYDDVDIAYWRLRTEFARLLCGHFRPLPQSRCRLVLSAYELGMCSIYGYPASRARRRGDVHSSETASYRGVAATTAIYEQLGLSPETNVVVHFHKKRAVSPTDGKRMNPIHPRGVSGGGIFAWPQGHELSNDWSLPELVGIFHTYKESQGLMIGTNLVPVITAIQLGQMKGFGGVA